MTGSSKEEKWLKLKIIENNDDDFTSQSFLYFDLYQLLCTSIICWETQCELSQYFENTKKKSDT